MKKDENKYEFISVPVATADKVTKSTLFTKEALKKMVGAKAPVTLEFMNEEIGESKITSFKDGKLFADIKFIKSALEKKVKLYPALGVLLEGRPPEGEIERVTRCSLFQVGLVKRHTDDTIPPLKF